MEHIGDLEKSRFIIEVVTGLQSAFPTVVKTYKTADWCVECLVWAQGKNKHKIKYVVILFDWFEHGYKSTVYKKNLYNTELIHVL